MTETVGLREKRMMLPHKEVTEILQRLKDGELGVLSAEDELHALLPTEGEPVDVADMRARKDAAYRERNRCVVALAQMAKALGWTVYTSEHDPDDTEWEDDWRAILVIESPEGQLTWHFHDSERDMLGPFDLRLYEWDGHDTPEKYRRLAAATSRLATPQESAEVERLRERLEGAIQKAASEHFGDVAESVDAELFAAVRTSGPRSQASAIYGAEMTFECPSEIPVDFHFHAHAALNPETDG